MIVTYGCKLVTFVDMFQTDKCGTNGDSVANNTTLHWKEGKQLRFGTMDDLFSSYSNSENKDIFYVLSAQSKIAAAIDTIIESSIILSVGLRLVTPKIL